MSEYFNLALDTFENSLGITLQLKTNIVNFPFPKSARGEVMPYTSFRFMLLKNNVGVSNPQDRSEADLRFAGYNSWVHGPVEFITDTFDLQNGTDIRFRIPYYALRSLKQGPQELELICSQTTFANSYRYSKTEFTIDSISKDTTFNLVRDFTKVSLIHFKVKFKINVPAIYKTMLYGRDIVLRNDSTYSPAGSDNTLWNSSYPDLYWSLDYPVYQFYCRSNYQKSTDHYTGADTFQLFHYGLSDSVVLNVLDHDNLSKDDYVSYQSFSLNQFKNNEMKNLRFKNIALMQVKKSSHGCVNP